jgi:hypothetical protein
MVSVYMLAKAEVTAMRRPISGSSRENWFSSWYAERGAPVIIVMRYEGTLTRTIPKVRKTREIHAQNERWGVMNK